MNCLLSYVFAPVNLPGHKVSMLNGSLNSASAFPAIAPLEKSPVTDHPDTSRSSDPLGATKQKVSYNIIQAAEDLLFKDILNS